MDNLAEKESITTSPPTRCDRHDLTLPIYKDQCNNSWKYVPTIISDRDSDLIGARMPQTQDAWEEKVQQNWRDDNVRFSGNVLWKRVPKQEFIIKWRGEEVADWLSDHSLKFSKDGFPHLCEQGDNICRIKWYNDVCSRKNIHNKTLVGKGSQSMALGSMINVRKVIQQPIV